MTASWRRGRNSPPFKTVTKLYEGCKILNSVPLWSVCKDSYHPVIKHAPLRARWAKRSSFTALESTWVLAKWQPDNKMSERGREWLSRHYPELTSPPALAAGIDIPSKTFISRRQDNSDRNSTWCFCWILNMHQTVLNTGYPPNRRTVKQVFTQNQLKNWVESLSYTASRDIL